MNIISKYIFWKIFLPTTILMLLGAVAAAILVPMQSESNVKKEAIASAQRSVEQFKAIRAYYTKHVIKKVLAESSLKPTFDHKTEANGIPLPATLIHDLSEILSKNGTSLKLYSPYPFPNRKMRQLDEFGKNAWQALSKNPSEPYYETTELNGHTTVRVGVADTMGSQVCVNCHNSRDDTPKNDWQLNDLRGVLEVNIPIDTPLANGFSLSMEIVSGIIVTLILIVIISWAIYHKTVARRLNAMLTAMEQIANGDGDLSRSVEITGDDEIASIGRAFNAFVKDMQNSIKQIMETSKQIATLSSELTATSSKTNDRLTQQLCEVETVATAMNQMTASSEDISQTASKASQSAENADKHVSEGKLVVNSAITAINNLATQVDQTSEAIKQLESNSDNIGSVLDVIRGIAEQTNLLALNAAIEAARAGEQGRGFAVVADEVRTLANRTQQSTEEIQQTIGRLQTGSQAAAKAMNLGREQTTISVEQTQKAGETLDAIATAVASIHDLNTSVATATEEQCSVSGEINRNITNINDATKNNANSTSHVASTAEALSNASHQMNKLVAQYKV
jgi:methyl-accepting chemotaxis protein